MLRSKKATKQICVMLWFCLEFPEICGLVLALYTMLRFERKIASRQNLLKKTVQSKENGEWIGMKKYKKNGNNNSIVRLH